MMGDWLKIFEAIWQYVGSLSPAQATVVGTTVGSALGFITLTAGALFNARLNRKRDERLDLAQQLALLRALATEVKLIRKLAKFQASDLEARSALNITGYSSYSPKPLAVIYNANLNKLTNLPPDALEQLVLFHVALDEYEYNLMVSGVTFPDHGRINARSFNYGMELKPRVLELTYGLAIAAEKALNHFDPAISLIEKKMGISPYVSRLNNDPVPHER